MTGSGYIGPEHVLSALAANPDSAAGHILGAAHLSASALPPDASEPSTPPPVGIPSPDFRAPTCRAAPPPPPRPSTSTAAT